MDNVEHTVVVVAADITVDRHHWQQRLVMDNEHSETNDCSTRNIEQ